MWEKLRSGDWLDAERLRVYPLMLLLLSAGCIAAVLMTAQGRFDANGHPLGTDFSQVWVAGLETLRGHPETPFDLQRHIAAQRAEFGADSDVYGWHYPPYFLAPAAALAHLPYLQALAVWQMATLALYLLAVLALMRGSTAPPWRVALLALAFPATLVNLGHGQNGFLTAALLGFGFLALPQRPALAGVSFALLAYKPQFALALPVALIVGGYWRALASAAAALLVTTLASLLVFGPESWIAFAQNLDVTRDLVVERGAAGFPKIQSVFAAARLLGADIGTAYAAQALVTTTTLAALVWLWRSGADYRAKAAGAIVATFLTTPYCLDYDMTALAPALALLVSCGLERGFGPYMKSALAAAFVIPLAARPIAAAAALPLGAVTMAALFTIILSNSRDACFRHAGAAPSL
ncbi:glycosyltransferase family 87 protein [Methylosinus sp. LW4]|uniref:glycosyltransferase family 87 protein n=1 Tax=Methylosinus sp. LW4 TaxID=136993 RepID=UPI00037EFB8D|nr:glycosyltransferase family 87 protein [Methylosinus sp. LW4]